MAKKLPKNAKTAAVGLIALLLLLLFILFYPGNSNNGGQAIASGPLSGLHFESAAEGQRLAALDSCINDFTRGWKSVGYEDIGNFYEKKWCTGSGSDAECVVSASNQYAANQRAIALTTLHYGDEQAYFGEGFDVLMVPEKGWGAYFSFDENGGSIEGEGFHFIFDYYNGSFEPQEKVYFGSSNSYGIYEKDVFYGSNLPMREDVDGYLSSPESMRDKALAQLDALSGNVQEYLASADASRCEYGPYLGRGIPPVCNPRALNESERAEQKKSAQDYFARQKGLIESNYNEMYGALMDAFPFKKCWR